MTKTVASITTKPTISINGIVLGDQFSPAQILEYLFRCARFEFSSMDVIKENLVGIFEIAREYFVERHRGGERKEKQECSAVLRTIKSWERNLDKMDRDWIIQNYWNFRLRSEKMGLLPGFGYIAMEKTEDGRRRTLKNFCIDPEKTSLSQFARIEG